MTANVGVNSGAIAPDLVRYTEERLMSRLDGSSPFQPAAAESRDRHSIDDILRFFELSLDLFCIANLEGYFLRVNPNFSQVLGYSAGELLARPYLSYVHPQDRAATVVEMSRLQQGMPVVRFHNRYRDQLGKYHHFEWTAKADGGTVYAVARDQSEHFRLQSELVTNRNRERAILDRTPAVIYVKGLDHRYQFINQQFAELFGVTPEEMIGKDDQYVFSPAIATQVVANDDEVTRTGAAITVEETVPHDDGMHTYISVKFPLLDSHGAISAVAGISTDVSDRMRAREAEQELRLAQTFQKTLYPSSSPAIAGLEIAGAAFPVAQVCGDYYDYVKLDERRLAISLGDVAGHGYRPALQMVELRSSLRILLRTIPALDTAIENLNEILCEDFSAVSSFVSLFVALIDAEERRLRYIGAGHDGFLLKADGRVIELESTGMVLGVLYGERYAEAPPLEFAPGDVLAVFTDGFNEAFAASGEQFGKERVICNLTANRRESARTMIEQLFQGVKAFVGDLQLHDDMTVVVVKAVSA